MKKAMESEIFQRTLVCLEWQELCEQIARFALSPLGASLCRKLLPKESKEAADEELALTSEMISLLEVEAGGGPFRPFRDISPTIEDTNSGRVLGGDELVGVARFLSLVADVRRFFSKKTDRYPNLWGVASALRELSELREALQRAIEPSGELKESAFPKLSHLKAKVRNIRGQIVERIENYLKGTDTSLFALQDNYYTVRDGRYVLPIRADSKGAIEGIVHDISSSGATHFVEPSWLVEMNNALRVAELEAQKEQERILKELSSKVGAAMEGLSEDLRLLSFLDLIYAKAKFSLEIEASTPAWSADGAVVLRGLKHPFLALGKGPVVANDLFMGPKEDVLVISGPNAGGKTVLLKAIGLSILMAKAGVPIAASAGSLLPDVGLVLADIGDPQDLKKEVSTFSGHMRNIRQILELADERSLVILDELAGSTDPNEGAALALAVLETLRTKGTRVFLSTHYPAIKAWAHESCGVLNAAMEFDWEHLAPTFKLRVGMPGQSTAIEIARRMGLPEETITSAIRTLDKGHIKVQELLRDLELKRMELEEEIKEIDRTRARLREALSVREELLDKLRGHIRTFVQEKRRRIREEIREARERIRQAMKELPLARDLGEVMRIRGMIDEVEKGLAVPLPAASRPRNPPASLKAGDPVEVVPLGKIGVLLDEPKRKKGPLRIRVEDRIVYAPRNSIAEPGISKEGQYLGRTHVRSSGFIHAVEVEAEINLRGMTVEDALQRLERYLDRVLLSQRTEVRVIHGHGTGALKKAVRRWLSECKWITSYRAGYPEEGGDGVTIVRLTESRPTVDENP